MTATPMTACRYACLLTILVCSATGCGNWNQQTNQRISPDPPLKGHDLTTQQLADRGEWLIFGGMGKDQGVGTSGKAQCPVCHAFQPEQPSKRAPNLWGIATRQRLKATPLAYLVESHICPSCYVTAGWGIQTSTGCVSPMPQVHFPPINLTLEELVALDTWLYVHEGETPPEPQAIKDAYHQVLSEKEWQYVSRSNKEPSGYDLGVEDRFYRYGCVTCHSIPGVPGASGRLGPPLHLKTTAPLRLKNPTYGGNATSPKEYIRESILHHDLYIVTDQATYANNTLPSSYYKGRMKTSHLQQMVDYLVLLEAGEQTQSSDKSINEGCLQNQKP